VRTQISDYIPPLSVSPGVSSNVVFPANPNDLFEVLSPTEGICACDDDYGRVFDLPLIHGSNSQLPSSFLIANHHETPRLKVVAAGRFEAGLQNLLQLLARYRLGPKGIRRSPGPNELGQWPFSKSAHSHLPLNKRCSQFP
jgi:hypothetical protein